MVARRLLAVLLLGWLLGSANGAPALAARGNDSDTPPNAPSALAGTGFTYQGELSSGGAVVNNTCDFQFSLYDAASGGAQLGGTQTVAGVSVAKGRFTVTLNGSAQFGPQAFIGSARWLAIAVKCPPNGSFTPLNPRQPLTPAPLALALPGLRTQQNVTSTNVIGGYIGNSVAPGIFGATIGGGGNMGFVNSVTAILGTIGGGSGNEASDEWATIAGGSSNIASGSYTAIGGGSSNLATFFGATVAGGIGNNAVSYYATVAGGQSNRADNTSDTIGGGGSNQTNGPVATIAGGESNYAGAGAAVGGGQGNTANGVNATVAGGSDNTASGPGATVGGGGYNGTISSGNTASGIASTVGGGYSNSASGNYSAVPGGVDNVALGDGSLAAGAHAHANNSGSFVFADVATNGILATTGNNQFLVRATGGFYLHTNTALTTGCSLTVGTWNCTSDRNVKDNFTPVDRRAVLETVMNLPVETWNYDAQDASIRHMGPMAQDFRAAFGLGEGDTTISMVDADGVALAAIQGLYAVVKEKDAAAAEQAERISALEATVAELAARQPANPAAPAATLPWLLLAGLGLLNAGGLAGYLIARGRK